MHIPTKEFQRLAEKEFAAIPPAFRRFLYNVEISVKALPGPEAGRWEGSKTLLGLYSGLSREEMRQSGAGGYLPARIILYQRNIEAQCSGSEELARKIRVTLKHEIAHHFGFSEQDIRKRWPEET